MHGQPQNLRTHKPLANQYYGWVKTVIAEADKDSGDIDSAMINSTVDYAAKFDVNEAFEDVMAEFIASAAAE